MIAPPPEVTWWNPFSWKAGTDYSNEIDEQREALNDRVEEIYGPEWRAETARNTEGGRLDAGDEITDEFTPEALADNLGESAVKAGNAVGSVVGTVTNAAGSFLFRVALGIPLWAWALAFVGIGIYLGLPGIVLARMRKGGK